MNCTCLNNAGVDLKGKWLLNKYYLVQSGTYELWNRLRIIEVDKSSHPILRNFPSDWIPEVILTNVDVHPETKIIAKLEESIPLIGERIINKNKIVFLNFYPIIDDILVGGDIISNTIKYCGV